MRPILAKISSVAVLAAVGGGLASALLSMLTIQKTSLAVAMGFVSPLPIMLATLSFGSIPGLTAAIIGALAVGLLDVRDGGLALFQLTDVNAAGLDALVFAVSLGLPAWLLAGIASSTKLVAPTVPAADQRKLGLIIASAAGFAVISVALDFATTMASHGGFHATMDMMTQRIEPYIEGLFATGRHLPTGITIHEVAVATTYAQMPILAAASLVMLGFNLWGASRIVKASGHFRAPWPDLARSLRVPRPLALVLAVSLGLSLAGGMVGLFALIVTGALIMAFAIQGLALIHDVTRGKSYRLPLLIIVYLTLMLLMPWLFAVYALVGLGDAGFSFRDRRQPAATGKL